MMRPTINEESDCLRKKNLLRRGEAEIFFKHVQKFCAYSDVWFIR